MKFLCPLASVYEYLIYLLMPYSFILRHKVLQPIFKRLAVLVRCQEQSSRTSLMWRSSISLRVKFISSELSSDTSEPDSSSRISSDCSSSSRDRMSALSMVFSSSLTFPGHKNGQVFVERLLRFVVFACRTFLRSGLEKNQ